VSAAPSRGRPGPDVRDSTSIKTRIEDLAHQITATVAIVWIIPFFLIPFAIMAIYSLATQDYITGAFTFDWTLEPWRRLNNDIFLDALVRSLVIATAAMVACAIVGYPLAYFVARHAGRFRNVALLLIIVPFWLSFIVRAFAWLDLLSEGGYLNRALLSLGVINEPLELVNNTTGILIGITYGYLPLMVFPLYVSLQRIDDRVLEASRDLGASAFTTFRRVTFPLALPGLIAGCIIVWIPALGEYVIPQILGGAKTYMVGNIIAVNFERFAWPEGASAALSLVLIAFAFIVVVRLLVGRERMGQAFD
jgi:ABC-type spermidine/putrescine transport system permease subunit I